MSDISIEAAESLEANDNSQNGALNAVQSTDPTSPQKQKSKWRVNNRSLWKRNKNKSRRNAGKKYANARGHTVEGRTIGSPCECPKKSSELLNGSEGEIFKSFWDMGDYNLQNAYLFGLIKCTRPLRRYKKKNKTGDII